MELRKYRERGSRRILIGPLHKKDNFVFQHCANGSSAVTTREYNLNVRRMLTYHGVNYILTHDKT